LKEEKFRTAGREKLAGLQPASLLRFTEQNNQPQKIRTEFAQNSHRIHTAPLSAPLSVNEWRLVEASDLGFDTSIALGAGFMRSLNFSVSNSTNAREYAGRNFLFNLGFSASRAIRR